MKLLVVAVVAPIPADISASVLDTRLSITLVTVLLESSVNVIWSPIFNSVKKRVPEPNNVSAAVASRPIVSPELSSRIISSPAFAPEPFVPFKSNLPCGCQG